jgi:predicted nucleic acid-binding protein
MRELRNLRLPLSQYCYFYLRYLAQILDSKTHLRPGARTITDYADRGTAEAIDNLGKLIDDHPAEWDEAVTEALEYYDTVNDALIDPSFDVRVNDTLYAKAMERYGFA